ncbi:MAG: DUF1015 domain-containing protein [Tissierellaceae bacterium]|nr:DUF1015 domain-containing protein [Tissierellaceae bacterium]
MIKIRPFKGYRPKKGLEDKLACKPYDVIDYNEALDIGKDNSFSFVHVIRPEIDLPHNTDPYSKEVYIKAKENLQEFIDKGSLIEEDKNVFYIYRQIMNGRAQNGIVSCISIDDYGEGRIKKHEHTMVDKEQDRINHFYYSEAHTEPVFLFYKRNQAIKKIIEDWTSSHKPIYDFTSQDGVKQILWVVDDEENIKYIQELFASMDNLYIADGHHRTASSYKVGLKKRQENPDYTGDEEFNFFMSVAFSDDELYIMPYNRAVKDLNGLTEEEFLKKVAEKFVVRQGDGSLVQDKHEFMMILKDKYYSITPKEGVFDENNLIDSLDVSILQNNILSSILGIKDPRTDNRIEFFGGEGMLDKIVDRLNDDLKVAFLLHPTQVKDITDVSDKGKVMPPKSTWFEPKLMSGLFVHMF